MTHLDAIDGTFLELEEADEAAHMHIGAVLEFEAPPGGEPPSLEEVQELLDERIDLLPRYRQRLSQPHTGGLEWPAWTTDPEFDVARQVRRATLPPPGGEAELTEWAADFWSHRMDRTAPLWEIVLVDGLADGRWALVTKTHHCMVDGVGSVDAAHLLLDSEPDGRPGRSAKAPAEVVTTTGTGLPNWLLAPVHIAAGGVRAGAHIALHPRETMHRSRVLGDLLVRSELMAAPASSINAPIRGRRRFATIDARFDEVRDIAHRCDAKVNDVVLSVVAGALRQLLLSRDEEPPAAGLRAMVPVNVRADDQHGAELGNRISSMFIDLPVSEADPLERLRRTVAASSRHKQGDQALGAATLLTLTSLAPPVLHAGIARSLYATRLFNITVTNVPGPRQPLYAFGARLLRVMPLVPLAADHTIGVAVVSYAGTLSFGLVGDFDAARDLEVLRTGLETELGALADAVGADATAATATP